MQVKVNQAALHGLFGLEILFIWEVVVMLIVAGWSLACHQDSLCYTASAELPMEEAECSVGM